MAKEYWFSCFRLWWSVTVSSQYRLILYKTVTDCPHNTDLYYTKLLYRLSSQYTHYCTCNTSGTVLTIQIFSIQTHICPHNTNLLLSSQYRPVNVLTIQTWNCPHNTDLFNIDSYMSSQYRPVTVLIILTNSFLLYNQFIICN